MLQHLIEAGLRQTMMRLVKPVLTTSVPVTLQRSLIAQVYRCSIPPRGCRFTMDTIAGIPVLRVRAQEHCSGTLLYLHGGGYVIGSARTHRGLAGHLAQTSGCEVIVPDYRLAPEHPFPAALDDAAAVYGALLEQLGSAANLAVAGDSAGGGLSIALALYLKERKQPLPASITVFSPWIDLTQAELYSPEREPVLQAPWTAKAARLYAGPELLTNPLISPAFGDLSGLPPLLIQVGTEEILLNDSERLADIADRAGVPTTLEIYNSLWHVFQVHGGQLDRASEALETAGGHIRSHLAG